MESIKEIFRTGHGPSSSHTMGPVKAVEMFFENIKTKGETEVTLYGSLAATGRGHMTDKAIMEAVSRYSPVCGIIWRPDIVKKQHPNALEIKLTDPDGKLIKSETYFSVGGGKVIRNGDDFSENHIYPETSMKGIIEWCTRNGRQLWEYARSHEDPDLFDFLNETWKTMKNSVKTGLENEGVLPGGLNLTRKAAQYHSKALHFSGPMGKRARVYAYALAVSEENACGSIVVTAPTCGSCGVLPAVLRYQKEVYKIPDSRILRALATAGLIGAIVKNNASISGAEVGCQGEVGTACAMASGASTQLMGGSVHQVEYAAEMGLEHHLGLTCDPVGGLVQIPCIERNALAAARALNHMNYSLLSDGRHRISFDNVVTVMKETGESLPSLYRETSEGGLAKL